MIAPSIGGAREPEALRENGVVFHPAFDFHCPVTERAIGHLDEALENLGVFRMAPQEFIATCPSGFRRVPISQGPGYYISLQGFAPNQIAYAHTHPDSEEWVIVLRGSGEALFGEVPVGMEQGEVVGRCASHPHGFVSGPEEMYLMSIQLPRPAEGETTWDQAGETTEPRNCAFGGRCRRCFRCGGHSVNMPRGGFSCENCGNAF